MNKSRNQNASNKQELKTLDKPKVECFETINQISQVNLTIKTFSGNNLPLRVDGSLLIVDIKAMIQEIRSIPIAQQHLYYNDNELEDFLKVKDYTNQHEETFFLSVIKVSSMHITIIDQIYSNMFHLDVEPQYTITDVKSKIQYLTKIPTIQQDLYYCNMKLQDLQTLKDYAISNGCIIHLKITKSLSNIIFVKTLEDTYKFEVEPKFTIRDLKNQVQQKTGILVYQQNLVFNEIALENDKTFEDYSIENNSIIYLKKYKCPNILIQVQNGSDEKFALTMNPMSPLKDLKRKIEKKTQIKQNEQIIYFGKIELNDDEKVLQYYSIRDNSVVGLRRKESVIDLACKIAFFA